MLLVNAGTASVFELPAGALAEFRTFAAGQGQTVPPDGDAEIERYLRRLAAHARFGEEGYYRVTGLTDPTVRAALAAFDRAALPGVR